MTSSPLDFRRRSLSEGSRLNFIVEEAEDEPEDFALLSPEQPTDDLHPLLHHGGESFAALEQRSKSESFICTAQGVVFQDTKCQRYQSKIDSLVALAASSSSSQSNVLLAKKALRYRKVLERRRNVV
ncbi:hypothetical protein PHYSODRAFT_516104 [Phytophthora sojae]|uniref:Uncharacterized protein n=1 Tax=Phytophthora sojae (strain P6497) TaxID=1094619 RepID=G4ZX43_PHYSP|nr:hypothetical protein PHYSODRAFT_516104 [Phytophthora sojae]EGZ12513.1 hypothetical protein PHYSODRAFT_516104 [Phytophthora sojae]|eukprot:XP_009532846.1 hypothetical protein PHYSODRAFT_516104 [Phytophthora sojae]